MLLDRIQALMAEVEGLAAGSAEEVEQLRLKYLSKKGELNALMADFRNVPAADKKAVGVKINELKQAATDKINALREALGQAETVHAGADLTRTPYPVGLGTLARKGS